MDKHIREDDDRARLDKIEQTLHDLFGKSPDGPAFLTRAINNSNRIGSLEGAVFDKNGNVRFANITSKINKIEAILQATENVPAEGWVQNIVHRLLKLEQALQDLSVGADVNVSLDNEQLGRLYRKNIGDQGNG